MVQGSAEASPGPVGATDRVTCSGCGGKNEAGTHLCEWCGRPFEVKPQGIPRALVGLGALAALVIVLVLAAGLIIATVVTYLTSRSDAAPPSPVSTPQAIVPTANAASTEGPREPAPPGPEFVRVANTGGTGAFIRDAPRADARGIVARADSAILRIVGPDVVADSRNWRNVEDNRGNQGWILADYLLPSDLGF